MNFDSTDKKILTSLCQNPHLSQSEIADKVGLSQSSVAVRIEKLRKHQMIEYQIGVDPLKMGLSIARVDIATKDATIFLDMFRNCPHFINAYAISGKYNVCLFFIGDDVKTIETLVNDHIRSSPSVNDVTVDIIIGATRNFVVPIKFVDEKHEVPQCGYGKICIKCNVFLAENCMERLGSAFVLQ
jgi:Lrp/AsnC family transcriptional regulator, leucine-responsive regulatory protein